MLQIPIGFERYFTRHSSSQKWELDEVEEACTRNSFPIERIFVKPLICKSYYLKLKKRTFQITLKYYLSPTVY